MLCCCCLLPQPRGLAEKGGVAHKPRARVRGGGRDSARPLSCVRCRRRDVAWSASASRLSYARPDVCRQLQLESKATNAPRRVDLPRRAHLNQIDLFFSTKMYFVTKTPPFRARGSPTSPNTLERVPPNMRAVTLGRIVSRKKHCARHRSGRPRKPRVDGRDDDGAPRQEDPVDDC